jgi:chemotaxis protein histidine kinase CheA
MTHFYQESIVAVAEDPFAVIERAVGNDEPRVEQLDAAKQSLDEIADASREVYRDDVVSLACVMAKLVDIVSLSCVADDDRPAIDVEPICQFIAAGAATLRAAFLDEEETCSDLEAITENAKKQWGDWLDAIEATDMPAGVADLEESSCDATRGDGETGDNETRDNETRDDETRDDETRDDETRDDEQFIDAGQIDLILSVIAQSADPHDEKSDNYTDTPTTAAQPPTDVMIEGELLAAYLDDAHRGLATIESAFLAFEQNPQNHQPIEQVCRELHTLKGASASVGLTDLASFLHEVEETLQGNGEAQQAPSDVDPILKSIDAIRQQINSLSARGSDFPATASEKTTTPPANTDFSDAGADSEETIRVKSSDLDRLMDMLAELIMLRNRRNSTADELQSFNEALLRCKSRLLFGRDTTTIGQSTRRAQCSTAAARHRHPLDEIAHEIQAIHRGQRELCERVSGDNDSISHFIRQFRQAVVNLRRVPISGLFRRLQRVARDVARAEAKQIRIQFRGETARLERSHQERLYEPLLHIVRNAVSHGIEPEPQRAAAGKDAIGTITLEAQCETHLVSVEVHDDGRGLDYDALRRRGMQRGLIAPDRLPSDEELAQLIFHPGFSTRSDASEISGRGVGMDVVSATLDRMRGWVEVQSSPGQGTRIRLSIPLRSGIEHAMVFRASGQLFAVPLHCIDRVCTDRAVLSDDRANEDLPVTRLSQLIGLNNSDDTRATAWLVIRQKTSLQQPSSAGGEQRLALMIDDLVGPEEMVVRPLPPLLRHHPLMSGATLAGTGEVILVLDGRRLFELGISTAATHRSDNHNVMKPQTAEEQR